MDLGYPWERWSACDLLLAARAVGSGTRLTLRYLAVRAKVSCKIRRKSFIAIKAWPDMAMDQYLLIPFLGGWTSIYQLFWCSPGVQGFDPSPYDKAIIPNIAYRTGCANVIPEGVYDWIYHGLPWCFIDSSFGYISKAWYSGEHQDEQMNLHSSQMVPQCYKLTHPAVREVFLIALGFLLCSVLGGEMGGIYHPSHWSVKTLMTIPWSEHAMMIPCIPRYFERVSTKMGPRKIIHLCFGCSIINHPCLGSPIYGNPHISSSDSDSAPWLPNCLESEREVRSVGTWATGQFLVGFKF